jgi:hypothetical protein
MDFDVASIEINAGTQAWGPYRFNFQGALPDATGDPIQSAQVKSYLNGVETTAQLIQFSPLESPVVKIWFNYPGVDLHGKHTLVFSLTAQKGGVNGFEFGHVDVG